MRILLVEHDTAIASSLTSRFNDSGYVVDLASDSGEAKHAVTLTNYSLIILDCDLPDGDGLACIKALKEASSNARIIVLTALGSLNDRVTSLDAGADDCITKPVQFDELLARMRAALRRPGGIAQPMIHCGEIAYQPETREFLINGEATVFNRRQHLILEMLIVRCRRVVQREAILDQVYGFDDEVQPNTLDAHVSRLRSRLSALDSNLEIRTIRGIGYILTESQTQ